MNYYNIFKKLHKKNQFSKNKVKRNVAITEDFASYYSLIEYWEK